LGAKKEIIKANLAMKNSTRVKEIGDRR